MTNDEQNFAFELTKQAKSHEQWISIIRFGMPTLLQSPAFLVELIAARAAREFDDDNVTTRTIADRAGAIFSELGLKLTPAT